MSGIQNVVTIGVTLWLLMASPGLVPISIALFRNVPPHRSKLVLFRECCIALIAIILFTLIGEGLLSVLGLTESTLRIAGGIILFLVALKMVFPVEKSAGNGDPLPEEEPFIVPFAIPLFAGPAVLAASMLYAAKSPLVEVVPAILLAWVASTIIIMSGTVIRSYLGDRALKAMERLMGLILTLLAVQMFMSGVQLFVRTCQP